MCHLLQKSENPFAAYGQWKLSGSANPKQRAMPMAQVEYPKKSQNICNENARVPVHEDMNPCVCGVLYTACAMGLSMASAKTTLVKSPMMKSEIPQLSCLAVVRFGSSH